MIAGSILGALLSCAEPVPPALPPPEPPPPPAEPTCATGDAPSCLKLGDEHRAAGALEEAGATYARGCAARPGDVTCGLAALVERTLEASRACGASEASGCAEACAGGQASACRAAELQTACEDGHPEACTLLGTVAHRGVVEMEPDAANVWLWRGCGGHDPWGCMRLAEAVEAGRGALPERSRGDVAWLRNQACDLQLDYACAPHTRW